MRRYVAALVVLGMALLAGPSARAEDIALPLEAAQFEVGTFGDEKTPTGTVESVPGRSGQACRFAFVEDSRGGFFTTRLSPTPAWDEAAGLTFWVKGDGSGSWGGLELMDATNPRLRYEFWFPIDSTGWTQFTVPWCDLIPITPDAPFIDPQRGCRPSQFGFLRFGKQVRWWEFPAHSFEIDDISLAASIPVDATDYTPFIGGTYRTLAKLNAKQPLTIVTMGDSLSDQRHWSNQSGLWSEMLCDKLQQRYRGEVKLVNAAIGANQLTHGLIHMMRWIPGTPAPDLVIVWFAGNDLMDGMTGPRFAEVLRFAVDRVRRLTRGKSDILLLTPEGRAPGLSQAVFAVAREKRTGVADVSAAFQKGDGDHTMRLWLYAFDGHLGPAGHPLVGMTVYDAITTGGRPPAAPKPQ